MRFTERHADAFVRLSGDRSPLYVERLYAARTSFGQRVVHGMLGVLVALSQALTDRELQSLRRVRCTFKKPLLLDIDYALETKHSPEGVVLRWMRGLAVHTDVVVTMGERSKAGAPRARFVSRAAANAEPPAQLPPTLDYDVDYKALVELGLVKMLYDDVRTFAATSYLVGMEAPGEQALLSTADVVFDVRPPEPGAFLQQLAATWGDQKRRVSLQAVTAAGGTFEVGALVRPRPVDESKADIAKRPEAIALPGTWANKRVLVTGASRGFGAALARTFSFAGAQIVLHFKDQLPSVMAVASDIGGAAGIVRADLVTGAPEFGREVLASGPPDVVVLNAAPPFDDAPPFDVDAATFVAQSLAMTVGPCAELVPRLRPGSLVVLVSSRHVVDQSKRLAHHVAAKAAIEAYFAVVAKDYPTLRFVVIRPPRMLTDQTNGAGGAESLESPASVAVRAVSTLADATREGPLDL